MNPVLHLFCSLSVLTPKAQNRMAQKSAFEMVKTAKQEIENLFKEKRISLYCASSGRSALAVKTLKEMGYTNVAHIDGGLKAWEVAGLPVEKP